MKRILTGDRTTGHLHLGHYVGSLTQRVALQDVGVQLGHAVDGVRADDREVRHAHLAVPQDGGVAQLILPVVDIAREGLHEATVDLVDDHVDARQQATERVDGPFLERLGQDGVVGVGDRTRDDVPRGIPVQALLVHEQAHELGAAHGGMGVVGVDGDELGEAVPRVGGAQRQDAAEIDLAAMFPDHRCDGACLVEDRLLRPLDSIDADEQKHLLRSVGIDVSVEAEIQAVDVVAADSAIQHRMVREELMQGPEIGDRVAVEEVPDMTDFGGDLPVFEDIPPPIARIEELLNFTEGFLIEQGIVSASHLRILSFLQCRLGNIHPFRMICNYFSGSRCFFL